MKNYNKFSIRDNEIEQRIGCSRGNFAYHGKLLQNQNRNMKTRAIFLKSRVNLGTSCRIATDTFEKV